MNADRNHIIIRTSIIGITANVLLAGLKAVIGLLSHSVAIVLDAVNNLSDALSSVITIIGNRLSHRPQDKKHPLGHGRIEYLTAAVIALIIIYAGLTSLIESVKKIISPEIPDYSTLSLVIVAAAVAVKIALGLYVKKAGKEADSEALAASGADALFDAVISFSTLAAAILYLSFGLSLEAWLGALISLVIIKSGIEMLRDTISEILGERLDPEKARAIKECIGSFPEVQGAYDLIVHSYGPELALGSVHIAVPESMTVRQLDALERAVTDKVMAEQGVVMTGISVYSVNTENALAAKLESQVRAVAEAYPEVLQVHGFFLDEEKKQIKTDMIIAFEAKDRSELLAEITGKIKEKCPGYTVTIIPDLDISD